MTDKKLVCDICKEPLDVEIWYKELDGFIDLFGLHCSTCRAIADTGGFMYLEEEP